MKKFISVMVLLSFFASTIIMTGCFGGSDGALGAGLAVFAIAIVASGGSAAAPVFAANSRASIRPAIVKQSTDVTIKIIPLDSKGSEAGEGYTIPSSSINWNGDANGDGVNDITATLSNIPQFDGYNQYRIKILNGTNVILEQIQFIKTSDKSGTVNALANASSTAKVITYDKWNTADTERLYVAFENNIVPAEQAVIDTLTSEIDLELSNQNFDFRTDGTALTNASVVGTEKAKFSVSGMIFQADGNPSTGTTVKAMSGTSEIFSTTSAEGAYTLNLPNGEYTIVPILENHTFDPKEQPITVNNDNMINVNFKAVYRETFAASKK